MLNGLILIAIAAYGGGVLWQGRLDELVALLAKEGKFFQWAIALAIIVEVYKSPTLHPIGKALLTAAIVTLSLRIISKTNIATLLADVAQGKIGFTDAFRVVVPNDAPSAPEAEE
jgi:hypothetical protein